MKITKQQLRKMIKQELKEISGTAGSTRQMRAKKAVAGVVSQKRLIQKQKKRPEKTGII